MDNEPLVTTDFRLTEDDWDCADSDQLRKLQQAEIVGSFGLPITEPSTNPNKNTIIYFTIIRLHGPGQPDAGTAVACGGLRPVSLNNTDDVEIKRMFVQPEYRGSKFMLAFKVLQNLEQEAKKRGYKNVYLETGNVMVQARRFYEKHGYEMTDPYGPYILFAHSACYRKSLQ